MSLAILAQAMRADMPAVPKLILLALSDCATDEGEAWPTLGTLARMGGCSEADVAATLADFHAIGLLAALDIGRPRRCRINIELVARLSVGGFWRRLVEDGGVA